MSTIRDLITGSLRLINVIQQNESPSDEDMQISFEAFNGMLSSWSNEKLSIFSFQPYVFMFSPTQKSYTLGPNGDWNITRPMEVMSAYVAYGQLPPPPEGDPYWEDVSLLLPLNGSSGSDVLEDFSQYEQNKLIVSNMEYSTNEPRFGSASLLSTNEECVTQAFIGPQFNRDLGQPYTIEFFVRWVSSTGNTSSTPPFLFIDSDFPNAYISFGKFGNFDNQILVRVGPDFNYLTFNNGEWNHIALTFDETDTYTVWINGTNAATGTAITSIQNANVRLGNITGATPNVLESYVDEVRITQGVARYTAPFTPPTEPFPIGPFIPGGGGGGGGGNTGYPSPIDIPIEKLNMDQYNAIAVKNTASVFPLKFYDDGNYPLRTLTFWPIPTQINGCRLWLWQPLVDPETIDDEVNFPKGYERALRYALAVEIAAEFGKEVPDVVKRIANNSKALIKRLNSSPQIMRGDISIASERTSLFNYVTGDTIPSNL